MQIAASPEMTLAILRSARTESRSQAMGSRSVHRSARLAWDALVELYGNEDVLRQRIEELNASQTDVDDHLRRLVDKYLTGWRPTIALRMATASDGSTLRPMCRRVGPTLADPCCVPAAAFLRTPRRRAARRSTPR